MSGPSCASSGSATGCRSWSSPTRTDSADQLFQEVRELPRRIGGHATVHRAGLDQRAPRRLDDAEPLAGRRRRRRSPSLVASTYAVDEGERVADLLDVDA